MKGKIHTILRVILIIGLFFTAFKSLQLLQETRKLANDLKQLEVQMEADYQEYLELSGE